MKSKYPVFDRSRLRLRPLAERKHDMEIDYLLELDDPVGEPPGADLITIARTGQVNRLAIKVLPEF